MDVNKYFDLLGRRCCDKVTSFSGVATSLSFDLYGCITVLLNPGLNAEGKLGEQQWFDVGRLSVLAPESDAVMERPDYTVAIKERIVLGHKGACDKPFLGKV